MKVNKELFEYTLNKLNEVGLKDVPANTFASEKDYQMIKANTQNLDSLELLYVLSIGFANGVKYKTE